jgi:2-polyprenyl-6-methoxyphenol hydroxylase-like FAD-dependent oxidoreductase
VVIDGLLWLDQSLLPLQFKPTKDSSQRFTHLTAPLFLGDSNGVTAKIRYESAHGSAGCLPTIWQAVLHSVIAMKRALIIGGSMAGLLAALMLRRMGWEVQVYERIASRLVGRGAGIVTHPELIEAIQAVGVGTRRPLGVEVRRRVILDSDGHVLAELTMPQIVTSWSHLYDMLAEALPRHCYHQNRTLLGLDQESDHVIARFNDGGTAIGDLLIGADGIRSTVRAILMPELRPTYAGYIAWRGLVHEQALSPATRCAIGDKFAFCMPPHEQILSYPVPGPGDGLEPGHRAYNFVWYRPAEESTELRELLTDRDGARHDLSIPPDRISLNAIESMRIDGTRTLAQPFAELVRLAPQPFIQTVCDLESPTMAVGRVALIGDAAFVARPHPGMGVTKAALDAIALAHALGQSPDHVPDALARFSAERCPAGALVVERGRYLGRLIQTLSSSEEQRAQILATIMAGTAVSRWS